MTHEPKATNGRRSKVRGLDVAIGSISQGATISLGGNVNNNVAMAGVREMVRRRLSGCELIAFGQGIGADLLVGAGVVNRVQTNYIGMEHLGLAPCFRRAAESDAIEIVDWDSLAMILALQAAASGAPLAAVPAGVQTTSLPKRSPNVYRGVTDPFTGEHVTVVPPLRIDVAVLYASAADAFGNARHDGFTFWDELIAQAADRVILVCEEVISNDEIRADPRRTTLPGYLVETVVPTPGATYPCGASPLRDADLAHLERYCAAARDRDGLARYLEEIRASTEAQYWHRHNVKESV